MLRYNVINNKYNCIFLYVAFFVLFITGRDTLVSSIVLGFYKSQILAIIIMGLMACLMILNNIKSIKSIVYDKRFKFLIFISIICILPMFVKQDYQIMYISIVFCLFFSVLINFLIDEQTMNRFWLFTISFLTIYSLIATYFFKPLVVNGIIDLPILCNSAGTKFYNMGLSFVLASENYLRNFAIFREPGVYQFFLLVSLYLNNYKLECNVKIKGFINIILSLGIVSTFSTNGIIEWFLFFCILFFEKNFYKNKKIVKGIFIGIIGMVCLLIWSMIQKNTLYWTLYSAFQKLFYINESSSPRIMSIFANIDIFRENILFGAKIKEVLYAVDHNTSSTLILFAILGILGGLLNVIVWISFIVEKNRKIVFNVMYIIIFFMSFNTQNITTNLFFWLIPLYSFVEKYINNENYSIKKEK